MDNIDFVTVKSGDGASRFLAPCSRRKYGKYRILIKGTKDISN